MKRFGLKPRQPVAFGEQVEHGSPLRIEDTACVAACSQPQTVVHANLAVDIEQMPSIAQPQEEIPVFRNKQCLIEAPNRLKCLAREDNGAGHNKVILIEDCLVVWQSKTTDSDHC